MSVIIFENGAKKASGKSGIAVPDATGYYEVVLGAFGIENTSKVFWSDRNVRKLFDNSSELIERVNNGQLYGEWGHPKMTVGMTERDYLIKLLVMHEEQYSHHIKKLELHENFKGHNNQECLGVIGWVKPYGPRGQLLEDSFKNSEVNTAFSLRSLAASKANNQGQFVKEPIKIITWDFVGEGGIACADKYHNPALESKSYDNDIIEFTKTDVLQAYRSDVLGLVGNESARGNLVDIAHQMGIKDINERMGTNITMNEVERRITHNPWLGW